MARLAWLTPLPPTRSGIADYSAALLPRLAAVHEVEVFSEDTGPAGWHEGGPVVRAAHEFVWRHARRPYDLVVYQLGNSSCHDFIWPHLARYPGLVVLHDAQLHHARGRRLLTLPPGASREDARRAREAYRAEFRYNHPGAPCDVEKLVVDALAGSIYYLYPMLRWVLRTARLVAVHSPGLAAGLREDYPFAEVLAVRQGMDDPARSDVEEASSIVRRRHSVPAGAVLFAAFGLLTPEKRIHTTLRAFASLRDDGGSGGRTPPHLMLAGGQVDYYDPVADARSLGVADRVHVTGYVAERELSAHVAAADVCLSLRWPSGGETSAAWLRALAAGKPTIVTDLAHASEAASLDPRSWQVLRPTRPWSPEGGGQADPVSVSIDVVEESALLPLAMHRLWVHAALRGALGRAAREHWAAHHTMDVAVEDYKRAVARALERPAPRVHDLPAHLLPDPLGPARRVAEEFGIGVDLLEM